MKTKHALTKLQENALYRVGTKRSLTLKDVGSPGRNLVYKGLVTQDVRGSGPDLPLVLTDDGRAVFSRLFC